MANGTFTDISLVTIQQSINDVLGNPNSVSRHNLLYTPVIGKAMMENRRNTIAALEDKGKEFSVDVVWVAEDGTETAGSPDVTDCSPDGEELGGYKQNYTMALTDGAEMTLKINTADYRNKFVSADEARAVALLQIDKRIAEKFNKYCYDFLVANIGTSVYSPETLGSVTNNSSGIEVPYANYTGDKLIPEMVVANEVNKLGGSFFIGGPLFHIEWQNATKNSANAEGKGTAARWADLSWYFDNQKMAGVSGSPVFQVSPLSYMIAMKNRHEAAPREIKGSDQFNIVYSFESNFIPGMMIDIQESHACSGSDYLHPVITLTGRVYYKGYLNPKGIQGAISGVQPAETANSGIVKWFRGAQAS